MPSKKIKTPIESGKVYHIYNRGNNFQKVFFQSSDYHLFLEKMAYYFADYCSFYAYALLPNHYHILIRANDEIEENDFSHQFLKFILSYTNTINRRDKRDGSLFLSHFKRIHVDTEDYLKRLIFYINQNPLKHKITKDFKTYYYCSYQAILSNKPTRIARTDVINLFGNIEEFISYHEYLHEERKIKDLLLEDE